MALSMGGGSLINAIMGQYGSAQRQRQQQQDQLMQMMQRGFVQTDQAEQARQGEGLLSQLLAPPERMRAQDFEMAPWNPVKVAEAGRKHESDLQKERITAEREALRKRQQHEIKLQDDMQFYEQQQGYLARMHDQAMQRAKSADDMRAIGKEYQNALDLLRKEFEFKKQVAEIENRPDSTDPQDYAEIVALIDRADLEIEAIEEEGLFSWLWLDDDQERRKKRWEEMKVGLMKKLPEKGKMPDALERQSDEILSIGETSSPHNPAPANNPISPLPNVQ